MSTSPDSSSVSGSDDSDLDDTPLFIPSIAAPTPRAAPPSFSLRSLPPPSLAPVPESPPVSAQKQQEGSAQQKPQLPGLALKGIATPDLSEPLPSSRTANPDAPRLSLTPRLNLSLGNSSQVSNGLAAHSAEGAEASTTENARLDNQHASNSGMLTARVSKPNLKLQLADPASASPVPSPLRPRNTMSLSKASSHGGAGYAPTSSSSQIVASLISTAFAVPRQQARTSQSGSSTTGTGEEQSEAAGVSVDLLDMVAQRCTASLGVARDELRFFELREISPDEALPQHVSNVGVMVNNSGRSTPQAQSS
jgi:hypothetical protein